MKNLFLVAIVLFSANFIEAQCENCTGEATYVFTDASVPPQYHRSYTIKVTCNKVIFTVDSYGEILLNEEFEIKQETDFIKFCNELNKCKLKIKPVNDDQGCTGGTGDGFNIDVAYTENSKKIHLKTEGWTYDCGGVYYGNLKGNITRAVSLFQSMVPDFDLKLGGTRNN